MACTTILIGKHASYDGSTIVARNEDSPNGQFEPKRMAVIKPEDQPRVYTTVASHLSFELPCDPMRYSSVPDAVDGHGVWAAAGFNDANVGMSATETIASNERVLGADPLVEYVPARGKEGEEGYVPGKPGGLGEEDFVTCVLPYIHSAREGVQRLGELLEKYGTYEMNGIAFSDVNEIWWLETIGGHHWIAKRVPDDSYVTMPNQSGIDYFDLADAEGEQFDHMASSDLRSWMESNHLNLTMRNLIDIDDLLDLAFGDEEFDGDEGAGDGEPTLDDMICDLREGMLNGDIFNPRHAFGTHNDGDHVYNTPRAWYMQRCLNPSDAWDGPDADYTPESDDIPWSRVPERLLTIEDVKYVLSSHYQGTEYDCYGKKGTPATRGLYRPIGICRTSQLAVLQVRPYGNEASRCVQWMSFGSNAFNGLVALYPNVSSFPEYLESTTSRVTSENFYWANRIIAALADVRFHETSQAISSYQEKVAALGHQMLRETDARVADLPAGDVPAILEQANGALVDKVKDETDKLLGKVLYTVSCSMKSGFAMSDNER